METSNRCPKCRELIAVADVNMAEGVALCRSCSLLIRLGELLDAAPIAAIDTSSPPAGCWIRDHGSHQKFGATTRSWAGAGFMLFFSGFWNSIVSIFVAVAIAETAKAIGFPLPAWFPAPQQTGGGFGGGVAFMWLFLTPFILVGLGTAAMAMMGLVGRVEVTVRGGQATVFTGVGPVGLRKRFDTGTVTSVSIGRTSWQQNDRHLPQIVVQADQEVRLGSMLTEPRRNWLAAVLKETLVRP